MPLQQVQKKRIRELELEIAQLKAHKPLPGVNNNSYGTYEWREDPRATIERLKADVDRKENDIRLSEKQVTALMTEKHELEVRLESTQMSLEKSEQVIERLQNEKRNLEQGYSRKKGELEREIHQSKGTLEAVQQSFQQREVAIKTEVRSEYEDRLRVKSREMKELKMNHEQKIKEIEEYNKRQLAQSHEQAEENQLKAEDDKRHLQQEIHDLKAQMAREVKSAAETAKRSYSKQVQQMQSEIQMLNGHLVSRERVKKATDADLQKGFSGVATTIDRLSRTEWSRNDPDWPDDLLKAFSSNLRKIRQQILQDRLWAILYRCIFCSPFRIFGNEGLDLEKQWVETFKESECKTSRT